MYTCSDAFHEAVRNGNEQKALLIFKDCVFTDHDICVDNGIQFNDYFNKEKDIAIGQTPSNELTFSLFNDERFLNNYEFGDFLATLGVLLDTETYTQRGSVTVITKYATYIGNASRPFLTRNGNVIPNQPNFAVDSILAYDGKVWVFNNNGSYAVYNDKTGENITAKNKLNAFMKNKVKQWAGKGIYYNKESRILFIYESGIRKRYEFVPLGWFTAERPNAPDVIRMDFTCYDNMLKFDVDMPSATEMGLKYPTTISNLFVKMCDYLGVQYKSADFINSTATIRSKPDDFDNATMRDVLKWIAEAAGSNAKFNRDGQLELVWFRKTTQAYTANGYREFQPYWYTTKKVTKLHNRDTQGSSETAYGEGDEGYLIQDNPLLRGVS